MANAIITLVLKAKDQASAIVDKTYKTIGNSIQKSFRGIAGIIGSTASKITGLFAVVGGGMAINKAMTDFRALDDAARRYSMTVEDLSKAQYAAFQGAGIGAEGFLDSLAEVMIKIEEFSSIGSGGAVDFFEVMNIGAEEFVRLNPLDQLLKISDTMKDMSDNAKFTFLDQIGSDNLRNMLPILKNGSAEFRELMQQAEDFGLVVSSIDARQMVNLNREMSKLGNIFSVTLMRVLGSIAPEIQSIFQIINKKATDTVSGVTDGASSMSTSFRGFVESGLDIVLFINKLKTAFSVLYDGAIIGVVGLGQVFVTVFDKIDKATQPLQTFLAKRWNNTGKSVDILNLGSVERDIKRLKERKKLVDEINKKESLTDIDKLTVDGFDATNYERDLQLLEAKRSRLESSIDFYEDKLNKVNQSDVRFHERQLKRIDEQIRAIEGKRVSAEKASAAGLDIKVAVDLSKLDELQAKSKEIKATIADLKSAAAQPDPSIQILKDMGMARAESIQNSLAQSKQDLEAHQNLIAEFNKNADENARKAAESVTSDQESFGAGDIALLQKDNAAANAEIRSIHEKTINDIAKLDIERKIETVSTKKQLELIDLERSARDQNLSAAQIADKRLEIEMSSAQEIARERSKIIDLDIKSLQTAASEQRNLLGSLKINTDIVAVKTEIAKLESEISLKQKEQSLISAELVSNSALLQAERANEISQLKDQIKDIRESAEIELKLIRGDQLGADFDQIEKQFADTLKEMEALGEDSTAIKNLIDAKKAKAELDQIEREYADLKKRLERGDISGFDFLRQAGDLEERGMEQAEITGNTDDGQLIEDMGEDAKAQIFDIQGMVDNLEASVGEGLVNAFAGIIDGSKTAKEAFADFANSMLSNIAQMISKLLVQLAIQSMLNALSGGTSAMAGGASKALSGMSAGLNHTGGLVGQSGISKRVSPLAFAGALEYHTGGIVGLKPNEVPIVAEKGEEMLTETDPRHRKNLGKSGGKEEQQKITINNVIDSQSIASALEGSDGERVIMNHLRANRAEIKSL